MGADLLLAWVEAPDGWSDEGKTADDVVAVLQERVDALSDEKLNFAVGAVWGAKRTSLMRTSP
jgi:hypothetical protein